MAITQVVCKECQMVMDESNLKQHISAMHLDYFPYICFTCKTNGILYQTVSAELIYEHTSTVHKGTGPDVRLSMTKEDELRTAVQNCRRPFEDRVATDDSNKVLFPTLIPLDTKPADTGNDSAGNGLISTEKKEQVGDSEAPVIGSSLTAFLGWGVSADSTQENTEVTPKHRTLEKPQVEPPKCAKECSKNVDLESASRSKSDSVREAEKRKHSQPADNMPRAKREAGEISEEAEGTKSSKSKESSPSSHVMSKSNPIEEVMERTKPTSKALLEKVEPVKENVGHYQNLAKNVNHVSEREPNRIKKVMLNLESAVYSIMSVSVQKPTENGDVETDGVNELTNFFTHTTSNFLESKHGMHHIGHFQARVRTIRGLIQACLFYQLFQIRSQQAQSNYKILRQYEQDPNSAHQQLRKKNPNDRESTGGSSTTTLSPAASTSRSNRSISSKEMVTVPMDLYSLSFYQNKILHHLMWAHRIWKETHAQIPVVNRDFIAHLDRICGNLKMDSDLRDIAIWLLTSVKWMNEEYGELKNAT